jgi:hypothetical protein
MYIGNDLQIAHPSYKIIDDISSGFNGSATSFALQVSGETPVPFPISTQQVMISVNGVVQEPDPSGSAGFKLLGSNIVFSSAPANGHAFFGVINAGADYVTAGSEFPDGSATAPSFTFQDDQVHSKLTLLIIGLVLAMQVQIQRFIFLDLLLRLMTQLMIMRKDLMEHH